jgi:pimeloyl-ACP methyl ester carboxylesterase
MSDDLFVDDSGDGDAVVLLHAFPCDGRMWAPQAEVLRAAGHRVLVPDLPGFGRSALPRALPSLEVVAEAVIGAIEQRRLRSVVLVGVSLGGYVAMAIGSARPGLVRALALCDTKATADGETARANRERLAQLCLDSPAETARILEQAVLPGLLGETTWAMRPQVVEQVSAWLGDAEAQTVAWYQRAMAARRDSRDVLAGLAVPSLVVWGEQDALSPKEEQDLMLLSLQRPLLRTFADAGHLASVERPDAVGEALREFVASV